MFNLFKKSAINLIEVAEPKVNLKGKTTNQIIEEIHETFYTEVDRLLADAKILNSLETDKGELILKQEKLKSLGYTIVSIWESDYKKQLKENANRS